MNYTLILKSIGSILKIEALFMLFPLIISLIYGGGDWKSFLISSLITVLVGIVLSLFRPKYDNFRTKDAFAVAGFSWILMSLFGALPFLFSGYFGSVADCIFESVSGFTTTGASILNDVEILPRGILFWRSFSHWIGGMGVLVLMVAVMPTVNPSTVNLLRAESTGPSPDKIVPKIRETAKIMYLIYLTMTVLLVILLCIAGLPIYDSLINAFSTAGTGGFSNFNASIGAYNNLAAEVIIAVFMFLFGISFTLYFFMLGKQFMKFFKDEELKLYLGMVAGAILIITLNISGLYGSLSEALRYSSFQVLSIISTAGFATADFNQWPPLSQSVLVVLMLTGCCAGSTGGGMKLVRILLLFKSMGIELGKIFHPGSVKTVSINEKNINGEVISKTALFFFMYFALLFIAVILLSIEGTDILSGTTAVISALSNIGPGLGIVGPSENYSTFSAFSKIILSFCMIAGRLEFLPALILFTPSAWRR